MYLRPFFFRGVEDLICYGQGATQIARETSVCNYCLSNKLLEVDNRSSQIQKKSRNHGVFCRRLTRTPLPTNFPSLENVYLNVTLSSWSSLYFLSEAVPLRLTPGDSLRSLFLGCFRALATFARLVRWQFGCGNWHLDRMSKSCDVSLIHH